jgi:ribose transport system substrate-binding protein
MLARALQSMIQIRSAQSATAAAQAKTKIPIIVKDKTAFFGRTVLAGARKAGQDLGVSVVELGADWEPDVSSQVDNLTRAAVSKPAAIVIAAAWSATRREAIDIAAMKTKVIGIASDADSPAFSSILGTDNV